MAVGSSSSASSTAASLAPGFRFHPTDEELVRYYLRRKVCGKPFRFDAISEIDIYKAEPWELPGLSKLKTRDLEWYFFSFLDKKYGNGSRTNRATEKGYWKTTGKDRAVYHRSRIVGMKKTLVFHSGRAPRGERTNWVMHEYRLVDEELENVGITQDAFVLCRVFHKSGSGPKNGEKYGAPFVENEWEDDELEMVPKEEVQEEVIFDDAYLDGTDLEQILGDGILDVSPPPSDSYYGGNNNYAEESADLINDAQRAFVDMDEIHCKPEQPDEQKFFNLPVQNNIDGNPVKREYIGETSNTDNSEDIDYLIDETFVDASSANPQYMNEAAPYLETNDLQNPMESNTSGFDMLEEYLTFFDADYDGTQYLDFDSSAIMGNENKVTDQASPIQKQMDGETEEAVIPSQELLHGHDNEVASSLKQDSTEFESDFKNPIIKHANRMLGSIPAPSAFASEFPSKNAAAIRFNSQSSSSSGHVTAGLVRIRNLTLSGTTDFSFGKHGNVNITLSFDLSREPYDSESSSVGIVESKSVSAMPRAWFYALVLCVLIVCVSFKIGTHICAKVN